MTTDKRLKKNLSSFQPLKLAIQVGLICGLAITGIGDSFAGDLERAKRMHDRLAGIPPTPEMLCAMEWLIANAPNGAEQAAHLVMSPDPAADTTRIPSFASIPGTCGTVDSSINALSRKAFYSVSLVNFAMPWTNEAQTPLAPLNDYVATVVGSIRDDDVPFDTILSADIIYSGLDTNLPTLENTNNDHYEALQNGDYDLSSDLVLDRISQTGGYLPAGAEAAGVVTTRAASLAFFSGGTNRAMWLATTRNFLCRDMEELKDNTRQNDHIRQDVTRSPGGDSSIFLNACMGCHAGMDALMGAYAYYDHAVETDGTPRDGMLWQTNSDMFPGPDPNNPSSTAQTNGVTQKSLINASNFEFGFKTVDNHWTNYWREGPNSVLEWGWNTRLGAQPTKVGNEIARAEGYGAASLGIEVTSSKAFAVCQVEKVYRHVCLRDPLTSESGTGGTVDTIAQAFKDSTYDMKTVFAKVATQCMGND